MITGQKVWTSLAHQSDWCFVVCRTEPGSVAAPGALLSLGAHGPARRRGPAHHPAHPDLRVQRGLLRRGPDRTSTTWWARSVTAGRWPWPPWPSSGAWRCSATSSPSGASSTGSSPWPRPTDGPPTRCSASGWPGPTPSSRSCATTRLRSLSGSTARWRRPRPRSPSCTGPAGTAGWASWPSTCSGPAATVAEAVPYELERVPALLPLQPLRDHLRRLQRDPAQHHRRAGPRPPARAERGDVSLAVGRSIHRHRPRPPTGHGLLAGKVVVVTAAAGTGIGSATASGAWRRGRRWWSPTPTSVAWARRPSTSAAETGGERPWPCACDVTDETQVQRPLRRRRRATRPLRCGREQRRAGGQVDVVDMTDEQWSTVLDVTLTGTFRCTRAALRHLLPRGSGVIVNNASVLGWRAQAGPGPLRRGQGRGDGAHPVRRRRGGAARACGSTRCRPAWPCTRSSTGPCPTRTWPSCAGASSSAGGPRPGRWPTSSSSWPATTPSYMSGEVVSVSSQHP